MTAIETSATLRQAPIVPSNTHDALWPELDEEHLAEGELDGAEVCSELLLGSSVNDHKQPRPLLLRKQHSASRRLHVSLQGDFGRDFAQPFVGWRTRRGHRTEAQLDHEARNIYKQFLTIGGYHSYRTRLPKKGKNKEEAVWNDRQEWAFFRGNTFHD